MKILKNLTLAALTAVAVPLMFQTSTMLAGDHGRQGDHGPRHITFQKCLVADSGPFGGHFEGTVAGECGAGTVVFNYLSVLAETPIVRFAGEYAITAPDCSFKAVCGGFVDTRTGHIELNGVVTEGPNLGDRVQVRAQLNTTGTCSHGTIAIMPIERE